MTFIFSIQKFNFKVMLKHIKSINEELRISDMNDGTISTMKYNLVNKLSEYREYILSNIRYNTRTQEIEYTDFDNLEIDTILRELSNEFTEEFIEDINAKTFLQKINQLLVLKNTSIKKNIRKSFDDYLNSLDSRIEDLKKVTDKTLDEFDEDNEPSILGRKQYNSEKYKIQVELLKLQEWIIKNGKKLAIIFEGRDAAGKGSTIRGFTEHLNPVGFKIVTLGIPSEDERKNWFERYEKYLPEKGEIVFFDRSWYNRAVIEPSMGYCTEGEYKDFISDVVEWEENLIKDNDVILIKFWFSITKEKQLHRLQHRRNSPLKYWKFSENDEVVMKKWEIISNFKLQMFDKTSTKISPWVIINSNDKKVGRLNAMKYVLSDINYKGKDKSVSKYYSEVINVIK